MKRPIAVILMIIYLAFSSGVVINYHFCMNELASARLFDKDTDVCGQCGMHNDTNGCCHDEVVVIKSDDDQSSSIAFTLSIKSPGTEQAEISSFIYLPLQNLDERPGAVTAPPPLLGEQDTFLQNRVFRI